jgi:hypothetical protein
MDTYYTVLVSGNFIVEYCYYWFQEVLYQYKLQATQPLNPRMSRGSFGAYTKEGSGGFNQPGYSTYQSGGPLTGKKTGTGLVGTYILLNCVGIDVDF